MNYPNELISYRAKNGKNGKLLPQIEMCKRLELSLMAYRWIEQGVTKNPRYETKERIKKLIAEG